MQNKPNFRKSQMNVNSFSQKDYENIANWTLGQNKPNSNPIKPNFQNAKMNVSSIITKDYRKNDDFVVRINKPNSNPIPERPKMNANLYVIEDYENKLPRPIRKNKPNSNPISLSSVLCPLPSVLCSLSPAPKIRRLLIKKNKKCLTPIVI